MAKIKFGTDGWRAIVGEDFTGVNVKLVANAIAKYVLDTYGIEKEIIIGYDPRNMADVFSKLTAEIISDYGFKVSYSSRVVPTPVLAYSALKKNSYAIMLTASHNPREDNGLKFAFDENGNCKGQEIQDFLQELIDGNFTSGNGHVYQYDIEPDYIQLYRDNLHFGHHKLKVVLDPANGATSKFCRKIYESFPMDLAIINEESDGRFPNHHPDPCVESNLEQLKKKVLEIGADVGISFDGDGDRLGVVTKDGKYIATDIYMILIIRDIVSKVKKKKFLYDVKCSKSLSDEIEKLGAEGVCYRTGNSYTKAKVREDNLPFGGELSGHVYFNDRWPGFDSGMYAGLRLLEILSHTDKDIHELLDGINIYYSTDELKFISTDDLKFTVVSKVKDYVLEKGYSYNDIDGVRVNFDDGWALVRCSNTGPNITARFEANSEERLQELQDEFLGVINEYI